MWSRGIIQPRPNNSKSWLTFPYLNLETMLSKPDPDATGGSSLLLFTRITIKAIDDSESVPALATGIDDWM
jgi:hypothetical protein